MAFLIWERTTTVKIYDSLRKLGERGAMIISKIAKFHHGEHRLQALLWLSKRSHGKPLKFQGKEVSFLKVNEHDVILGYSRIERF